MTAVSALRVHWSCDTLVLSGTIVRDALRHFRSTHPMWASIEELPEFPSEIDDIALQQPGYGASMPWSHACEFSEPWQIDDMRGWLDVILARRTREVWNRDQCGSVMMMLTRCNRFGGMPWRALEPLARRLRRVNSRRLTFAHDGATITYSRPGTRCACKGWHWN